jgi:hypothetical protein
MQHTATAQELRRCQAVHRCLCRLYRLKTPQMNHPSARPLLGLQHRLKKLLKIGAPRRVEAELSGLPSLITLPNKDHNTPLTTLLE